MTNVESMDYTHSHPSTIASLACAPQLSPVPYTCRGTQWKTKIFGIASTPRTTMETAYKV